MLPVTAPAQPWACVGEEWMISSASARRYDFVSSVIAAPTRSPGRQWRTKTTRPSSALATQPPPAAIGPISSSSSGGAVTCRPLRHVSVHRATHSWFRQLTVISSRLQVPARYDLKLWITHSLGGATYLPR
jgi:hypothetical protein